MIVISADFESVSGSEAAPVPAAGGIDADETALLFSVVAVYGEERGSGPAAFGFGGPFGAGLEFERLCSAGDATGPGDFTVDSERFGEILADAGEDGVADVVESGCGGIGEEKFVADMAADM